MRTTVELPPALMRAAKARSAERGESLKALLTRAVEAELGGAPAAPGHRRPMILPLFGSATGPLVNVTPEQLERALADGDATRVTLKTPAASSRPPHRRGRSR